MKHPETWNAIRALLAFRNGAPPLVPIADATPRPLSYPQERLWFLQQLHSDNTAFHLPHLLHLRGTLDVSALEQSLNALRRRHTILRTVFTLDAKRQPIQMVRAFAPVALPMTNVTDLPAAEQEAAVARWIEKNARQPFVLHDEPGMRTCALRRHEQEHLLLLVFHHIVYDFWSQSVLLSELQTLYAGYCQGQQRQLPALPIQYADFSAWQRAWLGEAKTQAPLLAYWQKRLEGIVAPPLPAQSVPFQSRGAGSYPFALSPALTTALKTFARQEQETLYTTLCAGFTVLLFRYTGQTDIALGGLMANRARPDLEPIIGNFVNLLILRTDLSGSPTFREVIGRVRQTMAGAIQHQDLPIQFLNNTLRLSQVVFAFRNTPQHRIVLPGLTTELEVLPSAHADFDLFFDLIERQTAEGVVIAGPVTFNRDCFADATIAKLLEDFKQLLNVLVAEPDQRITELPQFVWPEQPMLQNAAKNTVPERTRSARPQTAMEQRIAAIWKQALGVPNVDVQATFFELGSNSLLLLQVHQQLQATVAPELSPVHLLQYPTIRTLAEYLSGSEESRPQSVTLPKHSHDDAQREGIAIVGLAGRFPRAPTIAAFWQNLCGGVECLRTFTDDELTSAGVPEHVWRDPHYVRTAPVLDDIESFDATFFGFAPSEAQMMDPQHRLLLECAWEAFEDAGYDPGEFPGHIGVYAGANYSTYLLNNLLTQPDFALQMAAGNSFQLELASDKDNVATRISHTLNLKGPSLCVSTACSTSLVAVHLACQSLLARECDMALAGAVNVLVPQNRGYLYRDGLIFSSDGHCRPFDAQASGTMLGSGAGMVLLKRLADALADDDPIYAVIRGTAINNDGAAKVSYAAPSIEGQARVIAEAQAVACIHPDTIGYIEAHGTATHLGDPVEVAALNQVFRTKTNAKQFCALGSVKSNVGHLSKAAGMASLIKTTLALKHAMIPASLHYSSANPQIDFASSPFFVNTTLRPWKHEGETPLRAGVSAFGTGGTNAHAILEEAPPREPSGDARPWQILTLSARNTAALEMQARNLTAYFQENAAENDEPRILADAAHTLQIGRRHFQTRRAIVCQSRTDALAQLEAPTTARISSDVESAPKIAFLFTGQGPQRAEMGKQLYQIEPKFRQVMDQCCEILRPSLGLSLVDLLYKEDPTQTERLLDEATYAQPALFAIEVALAHLWRSWGIEPDVVVGHSMGEYAAACVAGVFGLEDGLNLITARGRLMQTSAHAGQMMAVLGREEIVHQVLRPFAAKVSLAVVNTPESLVISGHREVMQEAARALQTAGLKTKELKIFVASHSPLMEPILDEFAEVLGTVKFSGPQMQFVSNVTGRLVHEELTTVDYWLRHLREPVRFAQGMATLAEMGVDVFMEMGPVPVLLGLGQDCLTDAEERLWLPSLQPTKHDWAQMLTSLAALYERRAPIDWKGFSAYQHRRRISLPTYPFQRKRHWFDPGTSHQTFLDAPHVHEPTATESLAQQTDGHHISRLNSTLSAFRQELAAKPVNEQREYLTAHVRAEVATVLGLEEPERIGLRVGLFDLGLTSLLAVELRNRLQTELGYKFRTTLLFDYPTLEALIGHLAQAVLSDSAHSGENSSNEASIQPHLAEVKELSEAQVRDALAAEFAALEALLT